jgi:rod shape determining protein RodA
VIYAFLLGGILYLFTVDYAFHNILEPHQQTRINILIGLDEDPFGKGYNLNQSLISIGSGGFAGKGYLNGTQTKFKFVPEQSTDFIFCTVGEEWGFLGSFVVTGMFVWLLLRLVMMAERQRSTFVRAYGYGVFGIFLIHFFINIGMTIGLMPVIGIPLPFFSSGGSSLWSFTLLLFIFLRLDASRTEYLG